MNFIVAHFLMCDVFPLEHLPAVLLSERKCGAEGMVWMKSSSFSKCKFNQFYTLDRLYL